MSVAMLWFAALLLTALLLGTTFAHVLEMPAKMRVPGSLWVKFQHTLYRSFATVGGLVEFGALFTTAWLAYAVRDNDLSFSYVAAAVSLLSLAFFAVWLGVTNPVNVRTAAWSASALPPDWMHWRNVWEYSHVIRFVLHALAFSMLALMLTGFAR
jgi:hypothetical protein